MSFCCLGTQAKYLTHEADLELYNVFDEIDPEIN